MSRPPPMQIHPGRGLGFIALGASLHDVMCRLKSRPSLYPALDLYYSPSSPLSDPIILNLPKNGIRLRFDGPNQQLRLIEILNFSVTPLTYDKKDVVKISSDVEGTKGPAFRHVYDRLMGPTFPGEYVPPAKGADETRGLYVLSYPGVAFTFPLVHSAWSQSRDFVSLLSSSYAEPAKSIAIFDGESWQEARRDLYNRPAPIPRPFISSGTRSKVSRPDEIEQVLVKGNGSLEVLRRNSPPFRIVLNSTTPQDLISELGPPDAIYRKSDRRLSIHKSQRHRQSHSATSHRATALAPDEQNSAYSSHAVTDESDADNDNDDRGSSHAHRNHEGEEIETECFWNYFHHGLDVFISCPTPIPNRCAHIFHPTSDPPAFIQPSHLVATKILLYGNVPGSYAFNRYRRCRWQLNIPPTTTTTTTDSNGGSFGKPRIKSKKTTLPPPPPQPLTSESGFDTLSRSLLAALKGDPQAETIAKNLKQGMVLNRGWGNSPGSSCELLGGWEEGQKSTRGDVGAEGDGRGGGGQEPLVEGEEETSRGESGGEDLPGSGNTELFGFPGLVFEVLKTGAVSCLTVY